MPTSYPPFCELFTRSRKTNHKINIFKDLTISESIKIYFKSFLNKKS